MTSREFKTIRIPLSTHNALKKFRHGNCKAFYKIIDLLIEERCFDIYNGEIVERFA